ncbi:MAG: CHAD domain-containing protein [Cyanobacteria bacterium CRU_2_1]|nr:CHAD domain-containing protein [Cyanobacteria bacterium RU_5_0]NJR62749.1 CHAD domain-containing protein [Cyanobacteria bacterium CRU_2_1]
MKKQKKDESPLTQEIPRSISIGDYAHQIIAEQFRRVDKQKKNVVADSDPEHLHQMRVGTRRLRTALQIFDVAIELPEVASAKKIRDLARVLGLVRDLDVQTASLKEDYQPRLDKREQKKLDHVLVALDQQRQGAFSQMKIALTDRDYKTLTDAYKAWLKKPTYTPIAALPLVSLLPDILSPLLSELLMHPGWLIPKGDISDENSETLHDLRKVCKHVRYQTEFFIPFYGEDFKNWIEEIKELQASLGAFQDTHVLQQLLTEQLGRKPQMPELKAAIEQKQADSLANWEQVRQKYLDESTRYYLHQMLLQPIQRSTQLRSERMVHEMAASN